MENSIYKKLVEAQNILKAPKNQRNTFGNYNYRSAEDILEAVKPIMKQVGLVLFISDKMESVGGRVYVTSTATIVDTDNGESLSVSASARESENKKGMDDSQITGATSSCARKYALNGMFCIDDTKDADATNTHEKDQSVSTEAQKAVNEIKKVIDNSKSAQTIKVKTPKFKYPEKKELSIEDFEEIFDDDYNPFANKPEDVSNIKLGFGKHSEKTYKEVYDLKSKGDNYFDWLLEKGNEEAKANCLKLLKTMKGEAGL